MRHLLAVESLDYHPNLTLFYDTNIKSPFSDCNVTQIKNVLLDVGEQASYQIEGSSSKCFAVQTVFIFGENLKLAASYYSDSKYQTPVESSKFAGVATNSELSITDGLTVLHPKKPTVVKLTNTKSSETKVVFVGALPSLTFESGSKFNVYYSSFNSMPFGTLNKYVVKDDKATSIKYNFVPINVEGSVTVKWSGLTEKGEIKLEPTGENETGEALTDTSGEKTYNSNVIISNDFSLEALNTESDTMKATSKINYKLSSRPKYVPQVFGAITNRNYVFNFWTLVGPMEIPAWGFIAGAALLVFIIILLICICICCCCCKKKKKSKKSSSSSSSSFYYSSSSSS